MEKKERAIIENFDNIIISQDKINAYFEYIKTLELKYQEKIYDELCSFLYAKKQDLPRKKYINLSELDEEKIRNINYCLHKITTELEKLIPKYKREVKVYKKCEKKQEPIKNNYVQKNKVISNNTVQDADELEDVITPVQEELINYMELELDIECNNVQDILEAYKKFIRIDDNILTYWNYILKITNLIIQKISEVNSIDRQRYINSILDTLKYQNLSLSKTDIEQKVRIKKLQTIWKNIYIWPEEKEADITLDYKFQVKNIQNYYKLNKEEASIIWLEEIENQISSCSVDQLEIIIMALSQAKEEFTSHEFQIKLQELIENNIYIFENYFDIYMMDMDISKEKKNILEALKILIKHTENKKENSQTYKLFHTIIFEEKNLSSLKRILSLDPKFINIRNYDGRYFLESLLDLYINQIMNNKYYFLENTFDIYLKYAGIYMNQELKNNLTNQIRDTLEAYSEEYNLDCILSNLLHKLDNITLLDTLKLKEEEVYTHKKNTLNYRQFTNMLNRNIVTIDQNETKFFENAISCDLLNDGTYRVGIYVSDVVDCLNQDLVIESNDLKHKEFKVDANRYKKYILKQRKVKLAIAFTFILDEELKMIDFKIERARIKVKRNLTVEEATQILDEGDSENKLFYILQRMNNVARMMYRKRNPKGHLKRYMEFIPEIQREFTYFVNRQVATISASNNYPLIYKNQLPRNSSNLYELLEEIYSMTDKIEKVMEIASAAKISNYSTINRGNDYFDGEGYTQVTSPTRDLPSLLNQILIINNFIDNEYINNEQKQDLEKTLLLVNYYNNPKK